MAATDPALNWSDLDRKAVDTTRVLAMDAVEKAGNGHPGTAMSLAPAAYLLFNRVMRHDPTDPEWAGRDRFVLSCGHSSLTLYVQLYLNGYSTSLDDLKSLRQWDSLTPGHPEYGHTPGVEITTGPLGQGVGNAVGMAMSARRERGLFDPDTAAGQSPFDHHVYALCSDGDIEEGVSHESSAIAAVQKLGNLTVIYDDNEISIEDDTRIAKSEDVGARYAAYGWHVQTVNWRGEDGYHEDVEALWNAIQTAKSVTDKPSFIVLKTIIGWPAPKKQNTGKIHGSALGADEIAATKEILGFANEPFAIDDEVVKHAQQVVERGKAARAEWQKAFDAWAAGNAEGKALFDRLATRTLPEGWHNALPEFPADEKGLATRAASGKVLEALAPVLPELWGGSADLAESNNTTMKGEPSFIPAEYATKEFPGHEYGRTLHFGIREHGMGSILNGIAVHGGTRPYGGTFLVFSDYMRGSVRLSALMKLPVVFVWTHDSIGLGEDGPTHQPIETLTALRAIVGLDVVRPADANETAYAWRGALEHTDRPTALALSRQNLPTIDRSKYASAEGTLKGGYILSEASTGEPKVILVASGSEVSIALTAQERLEAQGTPTRVVSMPCQEWFFQQDVAYQQQVLPRGVKARVSVEAGIRMSWDRILGDAGEAVSIEHYGASAPAKILFEQFGFTADNVVAKANASLARVGEITGHKTGN
ncbi:putative transketolase [Actinoplanes missouriensis 431]|uniref:Transketolase n=1 Tax=Actinoplanes missouriensis (strain ATCC 14538 / DSM 43046 / CBS 188.64 / JCM 3121 / NBRC 102363 / NCIMB 12654 / NRRL B-3342 / UNCC 431) TaxID=512565 RepID=I0H1F3_ACTM4|nr:transketolase [Actinoplanes missouriensis]BAL86840.1 putative transketolase [Actinoplanes missouriensis 431]